MNGASEGTNHFHMQGGTNYLFMQVTNYFQMEGTKCTVIGWGRTAHEDWQKPQDGGILRKVCVNFSVFGIFSNFFFKVTVPIESNGLCTEEFNIPEHPE